MSPKPLAIDLFCGLGGWTEGLIAEGYKVIGFDNERHVYGDEKYPGLLVIQDVLTIHGAQFKDVALIVGSSPCQEFSYRAMPWKRAKALPPPYLGMQLFEAQFRIQREAIEAAGHFIPLVVENVRGAQKYVGPSKYHFGSFHLWGDIPALMPMGISRPKVGGITFCGYGTPGYKAVAFNGTAEKRLRDDTKNVGGSWFNVSHNKQSGMHNPVNNEIKGANGGWFNDAKLKGGTETGRLSISGSKSPARKRASAMIAKIPLVLSRHIAAAWIPSCE